MRSSRPTTRRSSRCESRNVQRLPPPRGPRLPTRSWATSLCCPSRATLLTGQYSHNNGVFSNRLPSGGYGCSTPTPSRCDSSARVPDRSPGQVPQLLRHPQPQRDAAFEAYRHGRADLSTYRFYRTTFNDNGVLTTNGAGHEPQPVPHRRGGGARGGDGARGWRRRPAVLHVDGVPGRTPAGHPSPTTSGLATPNVAPRHRNRFAGEPLPAPPSFNEVTCRTSRCRCAAGACSPTRRSTASARCTASGWSRCWPSTRRSRASSRRCARAGAGRHLIVFTDDNGFFHGEHRVSNGKVLIYEPSIRVLLILRGPACPARPRQLVSNVDLAPTILCSPERAPAG